MCFARLDNQEFGHHVDPGMTEADDVCSHVAVYICKLARVAVLAAPTAGVDAEGVKLERRGSIVPACRGLGHPDTGIVVNADVRTSLPVYDINRTILTFVDLPPAGVDTEGVKLEHRHDIDRAIRELEKLDIADVVHAIRHTSSQIDDMNRTIRILSDLILRVRAAIDGGVHAGSAIEHVVAGTSLE